MALTAVVLAGGPPDAVSALQPDAINKTFVRVGGVALVERTLRALRSSSSIGRIIVVAPPAAHDHPALALADERRPDGPRIAESLRSGLVGLDGDASVLIATADLPVASTEGIDDFAGRVRARDLDIAYGIVERAIHLERYPAVGHTWAHLRNGAYCGAGFMSMKPRAFPALETFLDRLGRARKHPLRLAAIFGYDMFIAYAFNRLRIEDAERRASRILRARCGAIATPYPELAVNVDRVADVAVAETLLQPRELSAL